MLEAVFVCVILVLCLIGLIFAGFAAFKTAKVEVPYGGHLFTVYEAIYQGAHAFLAEQYKYMTYFIIGFGILILVVIGAGGSRLGWKDAALCTLGFVMGACTSILSGYIGMKIAVFANARTAIRGQDSLGAAFQTAFNAALVMGTALVGLGIFNLFILILILRAFYPNVHNRQDSTEYFFEVIAGYGLGGSAIALFGRVAGGIYTKAADVGADLVGKLEYDIPEDSPKNPAVIADNVGDNVGDVAGMGSDLFGSLGESCCVVMVLASGSEAMYQSLPAICLPLLIILAGMLVSIVVSFVATRPGAVIRDSDVQSVLKWQLVLAGVGTSLVTLGVCAVCLPSGPISFNSSHFSGELFSGTTNMFKIWGACCAGLWSGMIIGWVTEYYTSNAYHPVQELSDSCKTGAATNIIYGLALGYMSTIVPCFVLGFCVLIAHALAGPFGIGIAAIGIMSTMSTALTIDVYGPICDNAGGIAEMTEMGEEIRDRTDILDAAGNTTAAIGKGFAIGSAALVALALFSGYVKVIDLTKSSSQAMDILDPTLICGLLIGAMLPYWFSAMTMKSVGKAALQMVEEVRHQFEACPAILDGTVPPDYQSCIAISTRASLREMIAPAALVLFTPIIIGFLFGVRTLAGVLVGALVSGVMVGISASNSGGAWDNAKKYISSGHLKEKWGEGYGKGSLAHKASIVGDTVGDPLKDTSGPSVNILIKLMAITSLVFGSTFPPNGLLQSMWA